MVRLLYITPEYSEKIEYAARCSTKTKNKGNSEDFVRKLVKRKHLSVGRHCMASFEITCSRACSHQLVRHTHLAYTQESQRYVKMENFTYIIPETIKASDEASRIFDKTIKDIKEAYEEMIKFVPKEDARYILPNAAMTRIVVSGNFQAWLDFIKLRTDKAAQLEIREIALKIKEILIREAPGYFDQIT